MKLVSIWKIFLPVLLMSLVLPTGALAQDCIESIDKRIQFRDGTKPVLLERVASYIAHISERDLYNSSGTRLTDFRAILQQDRANLHKTGKPDVEGDFQDDVDDYFTTIERRQLFSVADYYYPCDWWTAKDTANFHSEILNAKVAGVILVVVFRHPNGKLAISLQPVG